ncbi:MULTISPECIES: flagellar basal body-associated protein FliL [Rossellomorea]|uniref:Flagellar basal body-associated protein FliL n=2 Tax=Rossellomorea vietnamensis TaxID=218284 RepID=A0ACD4CDW4_9BACI|nr:MULTISPECIES: flagellar basal body-associated protein FliL [Rossellomorea]OXS63467.1 flagellar basal body-associated protein FliL [Bacillus sp. DSM 27956]MCA0148627.1 flagellar basal body-associated protein FliL [Rossellomorea vietnamensis]QHE63735.1 flagellar basal body-associated protein FliL [Rossellomorea vietnamensis]UTE79412.1 flagellar basal body-associated protein FliL [Rossellomorea sp. KS-H15a]UXH46720.1 flagellar basal body-associated protein FliL [Rossellomorea vietnamensis]
MTIMMISLVTITLVGVIALVVLLKFSGDEEAKGPSIEEVIENSVDIPEMTTNLMSNDFIRISFKIQTDSKKAKKELAKRDFQVNNIIIEELSELKAEELQGKKGKELVETKVKDKVNSLMQEGAVERVYITSMMIQ